MTTFVELRQEAWFRTGSCPRAPSPAIKSHFSCVQSASSRLVTLRPRQNRLTSTADLCIGLRSRTSWLSEPPSRSNVARAIPDWNWTTYPRTYTTPPPSVAERLLGLLETEAASLPQAPAPAFLFGWNPEQRNPESLAVAVTEVEERGATTLAWRSGNRRSLPINSRAFLIRLGAEPRGIIGVGWTRSDPNDEPAVDIEFQVLREEPIVPFATLQLPPFSDFQWSIQASGVAIPTALAADLDASVKRHIAAYTVDLVDLDLFEEGSQVPRSHLVTERDKKVVREKREDTLRRTGKLACEVCDFDFLVAYGERGRTFCEVHHTIPFQVRPGLRVTNLDERAILCSNCHRMVHRSPTVTVSELRELLKKPGTSDHEGAG